MEKINNNEVLRSLRYILNVNDAEMVKIFSLAGYMTDEVYVQNILKKDGDINFEKCADDIMELFLDGLIIYRRGREDNKEQKAEREKQILTNNIILKKIRIAFDLKNEDMIIIFGLADVVILQDELSAFFRKAGHRNYKECGTWYIRCFLKGLTAKFREDSAL